MGLKDSGKIVEAHEVMNEALKHFSGLSEDTLLKLKPSDIIQLIGGVDGLNVKKCYVLAELLKVKGDLYVEIGNVEKSYAFYLKSMHIYLETSLASSDSIFQPDHEQIRELLELLREYILPLETLTLIFQYFEYIGEYGKAEDILFELIEEGSYPSHIVDDGVAFYERLLQKKPEELEAGGLPLDEVREGLGILTNISRG